MKQPMIGYGILFKDEVDDHMRLLDSIIPTLGTFQNDSITILVDLDNNHENWEKIKTVQNYFAKSIMNMYLSHQLTVEGHIISAQTKQEIINFMIYYEENIDNYRYMKRSEIFSMCYENQAHKNMSFPLYSVDLDILLRDYKSPGKRTDEFYMTVKAIFNWIKQSYYCRKLDNFAEQKNALNEIIKSKAVNGYHQGIVPELTTDEEREKLKEKNLYAFNLDSDEYYDDPIYTRNSITDAIVGAKDLDGIWLYRTNIIQFANHEERTDFDVNIKGQSGWHWLVEDSPLQDSMVDNLKSGIFYQSRVVVNYPDEQYRVYRLNTLKGDEDEVKWIGKVHERINKASKGNNVQYPSFKWERDRLMNISMQHVKSFQKQFLQNMNYNDRIVADTNYPSILHDYVEQFEIPNIHQMADTSKDRVGYLESNEMITPQDRIIICGDIYNDVSDLESLESKYFDNMITMNRGKDLVFVTNDLLLFKFFTKRYKDLVKVHLCEVSESYLVTNDYQYNALVTLYKCPINKLYPNYLTQYVLGDDEAYEG